MTNEELKAWLQWRKDLGLKPVSQSLINEILNNCVAVHSNPEPPIKLYTVKKYLFGLIKIYKPLKINNYDY
jgi:hypothetical protein